MTVVAVHEKKMTMAAASTHIRNDECIMEVSDKKNIKQKGKEYTVSCSEDGIQKDFFLRCRIAVVFVTLPVHGSESSPRRETSSGFRSLFTIV
ncbi:MAG: hypothetical protein JXA28_14380 [Bacteroidetes bacterium]|nr:hypothetical protein [Bacteroidota bacterium]